MARRDRKRRAIELAKDALIVLLTCSALWLAAQTRLLDPLDGLLREEGTQGMSGPEGDREQVGAVLPMAMAVSLPGPQRPGLPEGQSGVEHYAIAYDRPACRELFQQIAGPLAEALSGAAAPQPISQDQWEQALGGMLGVYMDFGGAVPMQVLTGWLAGGDSACSAHVRKLVLAVQEDGVALYFKDEGDGGLYRSQTQVADPDMLAQTLSGLSGNGAFFAFESESYQDLEPDTLLFQQLPALGVYAVSDPVDQGRGSLEDIVQDLGIPLSSTTFYSADEQVARNGDDSVRLSDRGVALYTAGADGGRFSVAVQGSSPLLDKVEACRRLALDTLGSRCGEAGLYLISAQSGPEGWDIRFGYALNGVPVDLESGYAARFLVREDKIVQFTLHFRSYAQTGATSLVMPPRQAAAALTAKGLEGKELLLIYPDKGTDALTAGWAARGGTGEG